MSQPFFIRDNDGAALPNDTDPNTTPPPELHCFVLDVPSGAVGTPHLWAAVDQVGLGLTFTASVWYEVMPGRWLQMNNESIQQSDNIEGPMQDYNGIPGLKCFVQVTDNAGATKLVIGYVDR